MTRRTRTSSFTHITTGLALGLPIAFASSAWAQDQKADQKGQVSAQQDQAQQNTDNKNQQNDKQAAEAEQQAEPRELRTFQLQHRNPAEIQQLLGARPTAFSPRQSGLAIRASRAAELDDAPSASIAADSESNVLFVRGTKEQIQEVEELVKAVDVEGEKLEARSIGDKHVIPVSSSCANRVRGALSQLQLPHHLVSMGDATLIVLCDDGSEDFASVKSQTEEVISTLQKSEKEKQQQDTAQAKADEQNQQKAEQNKQKNQKEDQ